MFKTNALLSIKSLFQPFHHPLPLSRSESQKLLKVLTTSFRKQLDKEHGQSQDTSPSVESRIPAPKSPELHDRRGVDRHLRAILSNPLFSYSLAAKDELESTDRSLDPADVFDEACAKGLMDPAGAYRYLSAVHRAIIQSSAVSPTAAMARSKAGLRVVRWLRASGLERDLSFIEHTRLSKRLLKLLLRFMVAEGLDDVAWAWFERLGGQEGLISWQDGDIGPAALPTSILLHYLVDAKIYNAETLDQAYSAILRGDEILNHRAGFNASVISPWLRLSWTSTVESWRRPPPSADLYESFVAISDHLPGRLALDRAHLGIHHPTKPDAVPAVSYLHGEECRRILDNRTRLTREDTSSLSKHKLRASMNWPVRVKSLLADTVSHLADAGELGEAQSIVESIQSRLDNLLKLYDVHRLLVPNVPLSRMPQ